MKRAFSVYAVSVLGMMTALDAWGQKPVFETPLVVERKVRELGPLGTVEFEAPAVKEYYFGSSLVVVRGGGARAIVDFAKRDYTEVNEKAGTYWSLSFGRMRELRERLAKAEGLPASERKDPVALASKPAIKIEELGSGKPGLLGSPGVRHLRASVEGTRIQAEAWFDPSVRFGALAVEGLQAFDDAVGAGDGSRLADLSRALRAAGNGAFMTSSRRPVMVRDSVQDRIMEETASHLERLDASPVHLLKLPENLKRVPAPLESLVLFAEEEAALQGRGR